MIVLELALLPQPRRQQIAAQGATHELAVREPFKALLETLGRSHGWTLVVEQKIEGLKRTIRPDGTLRDATTLPRGYWEAKDTRDDLDKEIEKKLAKGYPASNIIYINPMLCDCRRYAPRYTPRASALHTMPPRPDPVCQPLHQSVTHAWYR
jgi:hypothetical protein